MQSPRQPITVYWQVCNQGDRPPAPKFSVG
jgi:hypothetical protein